MNHKENQLQKLEQEVEKLDESVKKHILLEVKSYLDERFEFRKNTLTLELEVRTKNQGNFVPVEESFINSLWFNIQVDGYKISDATLFKVINSQLTCEYNPLKSYFDELPKHDGTNHIKALAESIQVEPVQVDGLRLSDYWYPYLEKWLVASVATVLGYGKNHLCLILSGKQGTGKTTWLNNLCPNDMREHLICSHINPTLTDQNTCNFIAEKWFVNIDDQLETIFGKDFNSMKAIITSDAVHNRKTWHRFAKKRRRVCSFMGSVNSTRFLTDIENRRYLVFTVDSINYQHEINMDKVWAQALHLLKQNYHYWFSAEEMKTLNKINGIFRQIPPEEEWLIKLFEPCEVSHPNASFLMPSELLTRMNTISNMKLSPHKLSRALEAQGFAGKVSKRIKGHPRYVIPVLERSEEDELQFQDSLRLMNVND